MMSFNLPFFVVLLSPLPAIRIWFGYSCFIPELKAFRIRPVIPEMSPNQPRQIPHSLLKSKELAPKFSGGGHKTNNKPMYSKLTPPRRMLLQLSVSCRTYT